MSNILSKLINLAGNITGTLAVANGGSGVTTSTGSGSVVLSTSPTLVTPVLGTPASGTLTNCTGLPSLPTSQVRVDTGNGYGSTDNKIRRFVNSTVTGSDITYADSSTLGGSFTIVAAGVYSICYADTRAAGMGALGLTVNETLGTTGTTGIGSVTVAQGSVGYTLTPAAAEAGVISWTGRLAANDVVRAHTDGLPDNTTNSQKCQLTICQLYKF